jgi:hypothetical protein
MILVIAISIVTVSALALALVMVMRNLGSRGQFLPVTAEWIDELSIERYKPMMRLLDASDFEVLRSQPGYSPRMAARLRAERCLIFRGHLRSLNMDFGRVCMALKIVMVQSEQDRPDLAALLMHHQMMFTCGMIMVQARLFLFRWGNCTVDVTSMVKIFDVMRGELRSLVPSSMPAFG